MVNDALTGFCDINMLRTLIDQRVADDQRCAGIVINTGEDNYPHRRASRPARR
jgi:hypothetical protein